MSSTALTASVWGQGRQAMALSAQAAKRAGEGAEECHICRDDVPATIAFVPCKHRVCFGCVESMRAKNIFKADKGIKCPFCRCYVDGYNSTLPPNPQVQKFLSEANKAAHIAAEARQASERKAMQQQGPSIQQQQAAPQQQQQQQQSAGGPPRRQQATVGVSANGEDQVWNCGGCSAVNYLWRDFCSKCKKPHPHPYGADKLSQTRKDIGSMSKAELISLIQERGAFGIRRALSDVGVTVDSFRSWGSTASVREAVAMYGIKRRLLHVVELLVDPDALKQVSLHHLGNFAVQRLFEALAKLRQAFPAGRSNADVEAFKSAHNGKDPFTVLLGAMHPHMLEYCLHAKGGVYVVQCSLGLCNNLELVALGRSICPLALPLVRDPRGVFVLRALLDLFSQRIWEDEQITEPGLQCVDVICEQFLASDQQLLETAMPALSGKILVRAVAIAMPRFPALKLAVKVACHAAVLATTAGGLSTLVELIQLYGHNQEAMEGLRDAVACMCYSLQGSVKSFALLNDEATHEFLLLLIERLGLEQETGWLNSIAQELVGVADQLMKNPAGLELLKFTLSQPVLSLDDVALHVRDLKMCIGKAALVPTLHDLMDTVGQHPPPAPKYPAASVIQPELRYYLDNGWPTPLPPPPPPRPGEPGYKPPQAAAKVLEQPAAAAAAAASSPAAQQAVPEASGTSSSSSTVVTDAWDGVTADDGGGSSSWQHPGAAGPDASRVRVCNPGSNSGRSDDGAGDDNVGNSSGWGSAAAAAAAWGVEPQPSSTTAWDSQTADGTPSAATGVDPVSVSVRTELPIAVPVAIPVIPLPTVTAAAPTPAAAAAAGALAGQAPRSGQQQQQQRPGFAGSRLAAADFNTAAPARLTPGVVGSQRLALTPQRQQQTPGSAADVAANAGGHNAPNQQLQQAEQQQQQWQQLSQGSGVPGQQQQQQQRASWACEVCTYEHTGTEADFLFCAMCSSQRPANA